LPSRPNFALYARENQRKFFLMSAWSPHGALTERGWPLYYSPRPLRSLRFGARRKLTSAIKGRYQNALPRAELPFGWMMEGFPGLFNRFFNEFSLIETAQDPLKERLTLPPAFHRTPRGDRGEVAE
jgi:hypothetical protein